MNPFTNSMVTRKKESSLLFFFSKIHRVNFALCFCSLSSIGDHNFENNFRERAENSQLRVHTAFESIQMPETNNKAITTHKWSVYIEPCWQGFVAICCNVKSLYPYKVNFLPAFFFFLFFKLVIDLTTPCVFSRLL